MMCLIGSLSTFLIINTCFALPAFPGAEGFGASAIGGRGGKVVFVTNLDSSGPGSFYEAMRDPDARYVLFSRISGEIGVSGNWDRQFNIQSGNVTVAGHTSPGGIVINGLFSDAGHGTSRENMIFRHMRVRHRPQPNVSQDSIRLEHTKNVIIDHSSFAWATDETAQVSFASGYTFQNCIFGEPIGSHYDRGGILMKYATAEYPLTDISFHHNLFYRVGGRLPQIDGFDCQSDPACALRDVDGMADAGHQWNFDVRNNLIWQNELQVAFKQFFHNPWGVPFGANFRINYVNNYMYTENFYPYGMFNPMVYDWHDVYLSGNKMNLYPNYQDEQLMYCCNNFYQNHPNTDHYDAVKFTENAFPSVTDTPTGEPTIEYMIANVGAFPRDAMDRRFISSLQDRSFESAPLGTAGANDAFVFDWNVAPPPLLDSDDDGMPDDWEVYNGLNPLVQDHNNQSLSVRYNGVAGYDNLESYLNRLSDNYVEGRSLYQGNAHTYPVTISLASVTPSVIQEGQNNNVEIRITVPQNIQVNKVLLSLDALSDPFAVPSPASVDITSFGNNNTWTYSYNVSGQRTAGSYQILAAVENTSGQYGYAVIPLTISSSGGNDQTPPAPPNHLRQQ